jgi:hypothetical protein
MSLLLESEKLMIREGGSLYCCAHFLIARSRSTFALSHALYCSSVMPIRCRSCRMSRFSLRELNTASHSRPR